ncbi:carboxymuconolactone decarboxylase family protein [Vibrio sp. Sgm 5]|uniref:carboxymuconolactone decarboxylase family protein n=1 Tax=Vibrio sp. Sgm 5 TaxID=2994387 RepID=UPI0022492A17|nr:carboxymuconolactone decarboxylase family protein [Vibrio sp. Sgm 5]MCX2789544.1 carboxymuconolactone decarboxylase family protein [Vibrio sp. Sgm 5]
MTSSYENGLKFAKEFGVLDKLEMLSDKSDDLEFIFTSFAFGIIRTRKHFSNKINEIIALSCVLVKGNEEAIKSHIILSKKSGMTDEDIIEVFIQCIPFCGFDNVLQAISLLK